MQDPVKSAGAPSPSALISYSHDSPEHEQRVLELGNGLRARGVDAFVDQFLPGAPSEGWPLWMERQIEKRDYTLMVCTETYRRRFMEEEAAGIGRGVVWEARILRNLLYEDSARQARIVPVLVDPNARPFVPTVFRGHFYDVSEKRGFETLLRHLLREPGAEATELGILGPQGSRWSAFERPWLVPDAMRTSYFTGRDDLLAKVREQLVARGRAALRGLGGVGKTQSAIEYAVRHRAEYPDGVFWINAETSRGLRGSFVEVAQALRLAVATSNDEEQIVRAVLDWFNQTQGWLLIFDNVDDPIAIEPYLPRRGEGHVLLTSRESVFGDLGIGRAIEVLDFDTGESLQFLLNRTGREDTEEAERAAATQLAAELGNLPLALAQAAAYVAETDVAFADYLPAFRKRRLALLEKSGGRVQHDGVSVTWAANFEAVERSSPAAANVLRASAFLAPDAIPFELFYAGATALGDAIATALPDPDDTLAMGELLRPLARYSLVRTDSSSRTFGVHRLVQEIVRDALPEAEHNGLIAGVAGALSAAFPEVTYTNWIRCDRLVPHVVAIADRLEAGGPGAAESVDVLIHAGVYLQARGRYAESDAVHQRALAIRERALGSDHPDLAVNLDNLGLIRRLQGRYGEAHALLERAIAIREQAFGADHLSVAVSLAHVAAVYRYQGLYNEAVAPAERALAIRERGLPADHPDVARSLSNVGAVYFELGRYAQAQPMFERVLDIWKRSLQADDPRMASVLNNLGVFQSNQGRYAEALELHERALAIQERAYGEDHPDVGISLDNVTDLYARFGRYEEAEGLNARAMEIFKRSLGKGHEDVASCYTVRASLLLRQGRYDEAKTQFAKGLAIWESAVPNHPNSSRCLLEFARAHRKSGEYDEAERLMQRCFESLKALAPDNPRLADPLIEFGSLRADQGRRDEAIALFERALTLREATFEAGHPEIEELRQRIRSLRAA